MPPNFIYLPLIVTLGIFVVNCSPNNQNQTCTSLTYVRGQWVISNKTVSENFTCCPITDPNPSEICADEEMPKISDHGCHCQHASSISSYYWEPDNCLLNPWDAVLFCNLLGQRNILLIGDSTMDQTHKTLQSMIAQGIGRNIKCSNQVYFEFSDMLTYHPYETRGVNLIQALGRSSIFYDIIVFSTGPHYHKTISRSKEMMDYFTPKFQMDLLRIKDMYVDHPIKPILIYKTENPAHYGCKRFTQPVNSLNRQKLVELNRHETNYKWYNQFPIEDRITHICRQFNVNIMRMDPLFYRPDSHPAEFDCLHYCTPGPLNLFSRLLLHFLVIGEIAWKSDEVYFDETIWP